MVLAEKTMYPSLIKTTTTICKPGTDSQDQANKYFYQLFLAMLASSYEIEHWPKFRFSELEQLYNTFIHDCV